MKSSQITPDYPAFLSEMKNRTQSARIAAGRAVNRELVMLYWDIGRGIVEKQQAAGWGNGVVERLAADLRAEFPDMRGFSTANIWRMRQFYEIQGTPEFLAQLAREMNRERTVGFFSQALSELPTSKAKVEGAHAARDLVARPPWWHHVELMAKVKDPAARLYCLRATAQFGWSRSVLLNQIKGQAYERAVNEKKTHNFDLALPEHFANESNQSRQNILHEHSIQDQPSTHRRIRFRSSILPVRQIAGAGESRR